MKTNTLYRILSRLYNTIKLNLFYVLLSLLVPVILWKVQIGRDIVVSLAEPGGHNYVNIPLLIASFSLLALSNWVIPVLAIDIWKGVLGRRIKTQLLYRGLVALYNGHTAGKEQFPIRYFASLPWVIFLYVAASSFFPDRPFIAIAIILLLIALVLLLDWMYRVKRVPAVFQGLWDSMTEVGEHDRTKALRYVTSMTVLFVLFLVVVGLLGAWVQHSRAGLIALVIGGNFIGVVANYAYMKFAENVDVRALGISYFVSKYIHILSLVFMMTVAILLQTSSARGWPISIGFFSPIFVLIMAISLYLFLADVLVTAQLNITWLYNAEHTDGPVWVWYRLAIHTLAFGFVFLFFFNAINSHRIHKKMVQPARSFRADTRPTLTTYFDHWVDARLAESTDTLNVYLISGQGGGSRAAVWFYMAMNYLDSLESTPSRRFADHVFSISTVSGSTSGAAMYLADQYLNIPFRPTAVVPRMKTIYARNYLSSSFWGVLIGDGFEGIKHEVFGRLFGTRKVFPKDRNYYFQKEEIKGYTVATPERDTHEIDEFFKGDYLASYVIQSTGRQEMQSDDSITFGTDRPLFFINSAIVETGERGVFAPVDLASFSLGTDLYGLFKAHNEGYSIPLIACVNQSQAFPVINAYNYLDGAGRLIDGGIYENSGTATTLEIYETLRRHVEARQDTSPVIRFVCINIVNTNMDVVKEVVGFRPASVLNTLTAAFQSPFGGHEQFSYRNMLRKAIAPDMAYPFALDRPVPLTRMLQPAAIDTMYMALHRVGESVKRNYR
ncbi:hypothetical protein [Parapedobacter koreensis]|uniref:Patatin-like phospholipase n=1 Tax=Parapedobacter koreensis TaxID=332977 RepID=A0A1H7QP28_9SPHI|nr:hypothetical protein [Parapedobacter koreensis]SEL49365.1 hypothetical protein SAMN05421740_10619 [Parapedobacter koreensis]